MPRSFNLQEGKASTAAKPPPQTLARFRGVPSVTHVDEVAAPLLFVLGVQDRR